MAPTVTRRTIAHQRQNRVSLIVDDLAPYVEADVVYRVLLARGVFKWFSVRRNLIRLKEHWRKASRIEQQGLRDARADTREAWQAVTAAREELRRAEARLRECQQRRAWSRGYLASLETSRREIGRLCHSDRWQVQDNDRRAIRWLDAEAERIAGNDAQALADAVADSEVLWVPDTGARDDDGVRQVTCWDPAAEAQAWAEATRADVDMIAAHSTAAG